MKNLKILLGICLLVFGLMVGGCSMTPNNKTRPAPIRPRNTSFKVRMPSPTPRVTKKVRPAPSKRIKGLSDITQRQLTDRVVKINQAAKNGNWAIANRETNSLGMEMGRFRPTTGKGKTLRQMANFDAIYVKLQADVKTKNKTAVAQDTRRMRIALTGLKKTA